MRKSIVSRVFPQEVETEQTAEPGATRERVYPYRDVAALHAQCIKHWEPRDQDRNDTRRGHNGASRANSQAKFGSCRRRDTRTLRTGVQRHAKFSRSRRTAHSGPYDHESARFDFVVHRIRGTPGIVTGPKNSTAPSLTSSSDSLAHARSWL